MRKHILRLIKGDGIGRDILNSTPSGNGDITSILCVLPNAAFDSAADSSNTPGEIDSAKISISGGLYFKIIFKSMVLDLDPVGGGTTDNQTN